MHADVSRLKFTEKNDPSVYFLAKPLLHPLFDPLKKIKILKISQKKNFSKNFFRLIITSVFWPEKSIPAVKNFIKCKEKPLEG